MPLKLMFFIAFCVAIATPSDNVAQTPAAPSTPAAVSRPEDRREFRFLSTSKVATMEKELNERAAEGFRLDRVSKTVLSGDLAVLVVRDPSAQEGIHEEYKIISTMRAGTMEKEIVDAGTQGYELRGLISMFRPGITLLGVGDETAAVMERPKDQKTARFEYKLLSTRRESTTQKELDQAVDAGFTPFDIILGQDNGAKSLLLGPQYVITIILGRAVETAAGNAPTREYKFLRTAKVGTMEKEMNQAVKEGYRYFMSAANLLMLMSRERGVKEPAKYQYKLLATRRTGTMQKELFAEGRNGYRYLATTSGLGGLTTVLEQDLSLDAKQRRREYKLLAATREKTTQKEISEALSAGYELLDLTTLGEFIIILDRKDESEPFLSRLIGSKNQSELISNVRNYSKVTGDK